MKARQIISLLLVFAMCSHAAAQTELDSNNDVSTLRATTGGAWQVLKTDKRHNITTYYQREDQKQFRSFKAEAEYEQGLESSACQLLDADNFEHWFMNVRESKLLRRVSDTEFYMYLRFKAPFDLPDRDIPLHVTVTPYSAARGELTVHFSGVPDLLPVKPNTLRLAAWEVVTRLRPLPDNRSAEVTDGYVEPGKTAIPGWLISYFQRQMPYANTLARGRDMGRYAKADERCPYRLKDND